MTSKHYRHLAFDVIERFANATSAQQLATLLPSTFAKFGYSSIAFMGLPPPTKGAGPLVLVDCLAKGWLETYTHEAFYAADHLINHARVACEPFEFSHTPYERNKAPDTKRFIQALKSFRVGNGLMVPIGRPTNVPACLALAGENPDLQPAAKRAAEVIALYAAGRLCAFLRPGERRDSQKCLTQREREVLQWIAAGKTSWEIGVMLSVSEQAINKIISGAMVKLDAVTRTQAVVKAIRDGDIEL
jgi:LuxR family quorum sensing-dependent transcriptional regulator